MGRENFCERFFRIVEKDNFSGDFLNNWIFK